MKVSKLLALPFNLSCWRTTRPVTHGSSIDKPISRWDRLRDSIKPKSTLECPDILTSLVFHAIELGVVHTEWTKLFNVLRTWFSNYCIVLTAKSWAKPGTVCLPHRNICIKESLENENRRQCDWRCMVPLAALAGRVFLTRHFEASIGQ